MVKMYKVLVVDDEEVFRNNIVRMLKANGYEAVGASNGEEALETIAGDEFDVVLLDLKMPGMPGEAVLKALQESESDVEVIVLTGHLDDDAGISLIQQGAFDYRVKPTSQEYLLESIQLACEERALRQNLND